MGTRLQHILRSLCVNTDWKYAVFWKLNHRTRMVLTWEDVYYNNCDLRESSENKLSGCTVEKLHDGQFSRDQLGLAVAKMSYQVFSLGEGIVGQVAVTGKHQWIFADKHDTAPCSSFESSDGWQSQFSAGITTVVVVAVPHGVVQLGSLHKMSEDMKLVTRIRDLFLATQDSPIDIASTAHTVMKNLAYQQELSTDSLAPALIPDYLCDFGKAVVGKPQDVWVPMFSHRGRFDDNSSNIFPVLGNHPDMAVEVVNDQNLLRQPNLEVDQSNQLLEGRSNNINTVHQNYAQMKLLNHEKSETVTGSPKDMGASSVADVTSSQNFVVDHCDPLKFINADENLGEHGACFSSNVMDSSICSGPFLNNLDIYHNGVFHVPETSDVKFRNELEMVGLETSFSHMNALNTSLKFSAVSELHEALGPAFLKKNAHTDWGDGKNGDRIMTELPEGTSGSQLTSDSGPEDLLEAVVANICHTENVKSERSFCKTVRSSLSTENFPEPSNYSKHTVDSSGYSISKPTLLQGKIQQCLSSSDLSGVMSSNGVSSTCLSTCSEQFERSSEPAKNGKKRARPGESGRPRPRDRQLIQDRIKELRDLVPNGSKCSIDSLLERTIKHTLFLQSVTQHAEKLNKLATSKMSHKEAGILESSSFEKGSSWAVEVGSHLKVCSIMVENLNKNGQMLVEMLCEDCSHFLEIAEAIRSLGLTILKGVTEPRGEKMWICFVVEGQNNRTIHRMDILLPLVQILQSNTSN